VGKSARETAHSSDGRKTITVLSPPPGALRKYFWVHWNTKRKEEKKLKKTTVFFFSAVETGVTVFSMGLPHNLHKGSLARKQTS